MIIRSSHLLKINSSFLFIFLLIVSSILNTENTFCQQHVSSDLEEAKNNFYQAGKSRQKYQESQTRLEALLLQNPSIDDRIEIYVYMGACFFYTNNIDKAKERIRNIVQYDKSLDFNKKFGDYFLEDYTNFFNQTWDNLFGALHIETDPNGANVSLDDVKHVDEEGKPIKTPVTIFNIPIGEHKISLEKAGFQKRVSVVNISSNETTSLIYPFTPGVYTGFVSITSNPPYAAVYLDGVLQKEIKTPAIIGDLSAEKQHEVKLELKGYNPENRKFSISAKDTTYLQIEMKRHSSPGGILTGFKVKGFGGISAGNAVFKDQHIKGSSLQNIDEPFTGSISAGGGIILDLFNKLSIGIDFIWIETMDYTDTYNDFVAGVVYPKMTRNLLYEFSSINIASSICYLFSLPINIKPYIGAGASFIFYNFKETNNFSDYNFDIGGGIDIEMQQSISQTLINFNAIAGVRFDLFYRLGLFAEANYSFPTNCKITLTGNSVTKIINGVSGTSIITETRPERENTIRLNPIKIKAGIYFSIK